MPILSAFILSLSYKELLWSAKWCVELEWFCMFKTVPKSPYGQYGVHEGMCFWPQNDSSTCLRDRLHHIESPGLSLFRLAGFPFSLGSSDTIVYDISIALKLTSPILHTAPAKHTMLQRRFSLLNLRIKKWRSVMSSSELKKETLFHFLSFTTFVNRFFSVSSETLHSFGRRLHELGSLWTVLQHIWEYFGNYSRESQQKTAAY